MTANPLKVAAGLAAAALILAVLQSGAAQQAPRAKTEKPEAEGTTRTVPAERTADERAIRASAEKFVKAFVSAACKRRRSS